jgi:hypothetical protein
MCYLLDTRRLSLSREAAIREYEEIDVLGCQAAASAESKCRKLRKGSIAFSLELNRLQLTIRAWSLLLNKAKGKKVSSRMLSRALKNAKITEEARGLTIQAIQEQLKDSYKKYYAKKRSAHELWQTALENLADAIAETGNSTQAQVLKALRERKKQRATARKIRYLQGKIRSGSTTMVTTIDNDGKRVDLTNQWDIELAILVNNK